MAGNGFAVLMAAEDSMSEEVEKEAAVASTAAAVLAAEAAAIRHDLQWIRGCAGSSLFHDGLHDVQLQLEARLAVTVAKLATFT